MRNKRALVFFLCTMVMLSIVLGGCGTSSAPAKKPDFPTKEITLIVPFTAGGATDIMARQLQPIFKKELNANLVVKNVEGGGSAVGITEAINAKPDGYTVGLATSSFIALAAQGRIPLGVDKATNISFLSEDPLILVVKADGKYADVASFIKAAKEAPGKISIAQAGTNNANHAFAILLGKAAGVELRNMPFNGASRVVTEIIGGHIDSGVMKPGDCLSQLKSGKVKAIGTFTRQRVKTLPDVPTFAELKYDVFPYGDINMITYIMAPKGVDKATREKLAQMFKTAISSPEFQKIANDSNFMTNPISGDELDKKITAVYDGFKATSQSIFK